MSLLPPPSSQLPPPPWAPPPGQARSVEPGPSVGWAAGLWVVAALSLVATLLFGGLAGYGFWISHHMATEGVTTTAIVTEVETDGDVILDFTTDQGRKVTAELTWLSFDLPEVDDEVQITYDPDDVSYVVPAGSDEDRVLAMVFFVIAGVGLMVAVGSAAGATLVHRARSRTANQLG